MGMRMVIMVINNSGEVTVCYGDDGNEGDGGVL
jgi:hypothetical protein